MTTSAELLTSFDAQLADIKAAFVEERSALEARLARAEADAAAYKDLLSQESEKAQIAVRTTATLLAHLGTASKVFEEARNVALAAGADLKMVAQSTAAVVKTDVDAAVARIEGMLHNTPTNGTSQ